MYKYRKREGNDPLFTFETIHELTFYVAFRYMGAENFPLENLYSLDFGETERNKSPIDQEISITILKIITDFVSENNHIILHYICDSMDNKQDFRDRLFSRWFSITSPKNWNKYDILLENYENYRLSFLYNADIYNSRFIEREIILTLDSLEREKQ